MSHISKTSDHEALHNPEEPWEMQEKMYLLIVHHKNCRQLTENFPTLPNFLVMDKSFLNSV
jgi:hypothetical protein